MSYSHLSSKERQVISHLALCDLSLREIGRCLHRHPSTISRETLIHNSSSDTITIEMGPMLAERQQIRTIRIFCQPS